jgi:Domain of unknown function (DUF4118)
VQVTDHLRSHRSSYAVVGSLVAPLGVAAGFIPFRTSFTNVGAALVLVALIEALAILGRRLGGLVATLSAAVWFDYFLTRPYERFTISHRPDLETTITLVVVGVIVTELAARSRTHRHVADEAGGYVRLLAEAAARVSSGDEGDVAHSTSRELTRILGLRGCGFEADVVGSPYARIGPDGSVIHVGMRWPADDIGIPGPRAEILCQWRGETLGRFVLTPTPGLSVSKEQRVAAVALVNIVAGLLRDRHPWGPGT